MPPHLAFKLMQQKVLPSPVETPMWKSRPLLLNPCHSPGDDGQVGRGHAGAHEQHYVLVARLPVVHHLLLEELQVVLVVAVHLQQADGHLAVPAALVDLPPAALRSTQTWTLTFRSNLDPGPTRVTSVMGIFH